MRPWRRLRGSYATTLLWNGEVSDLAHAEKLATRKLRELEPPDPVGSLTLTGSETGPLGWLFYYDSVEYVQSGDLMHALIGNGPIVVLRDGRVETFDTAVPDMDRAWAAIGRDGTIWDS